MCIRDRYKKNDIKFKANQNGECNGPEIRMYDGSNDNPGRTEKDRTDRCFEACKYRKKSSAPKSRWRWTPRGFIVVPNTGRCYCEKVSGANCKPTKIYTPKNPNQYIRYDLVTNTTKFDKGIVKDKDLKKNGINNVINNQKYDILPLGDNTRCNNTNRELLGNFSILNCINNGIKKVHKDKSSIAFIEFAGFKNKGMSKKERLNMIGRCYKNRETYVHTCDPIKSKYFMTFLIKK